MPIKRLTIKNDGILVTDLLRVFYIVCIEVMPKTSYLRLGLPCPQKCVSIQEMTGWMSRNLWFQQIGQKKIE